MDDYGDASIYLTHEDGLLFSGLYLLWVYCSTYTCATKAERWAALKNLIPAIVAGVLILVYIFILMDKPGVFGIYLFKFFLAGVFIKIAIDEARRNAYKKIEQEREGRNRDGQ